MREIVEFRDRRDTADTWAIKNPILAEGEHGLELDTGKFKIGNGIKRWLELPYYAPVGVASSSELNQHVVSLTPHPVYDDGPSLFLLYENAKV